MSTVWYRGLRLIDGTGAPPVDRTTIGVVDGRIVSVGGDVPPDAEVRDLGGATVLPGLVNADEYLTIKGVSSYYYDIYRQSSHFQLLRAARNALYSLAQGITAVRDVGAIGRVNVVLRDAIDLGVVVGPRIYTCGSPIAPAYDTPGAREPGMTVEAANAVEVAGRVDELLAERVDFIMIKVDRRDFTANDRRWFSIEEMRPGVRAAIAAGLPVGGTAPSPAAMRDAVEAGVRSFGSGRSIVEDPELPGFLAAHEVTIVPNLAAWHRNSRWLTPERRAQHVEGIRRCLEAGVTLAAGTTLYGDNLVDEILELRAIGMTAMESLQAATIAGARLLGREADFGTVEVGKRADLVVVAGDPLADPENLRDVLLTIRDGIEYHPAALREAIGREVEAPVEQRSAATAFVQNGRTG
ncbi:MAG: amidohydrolase family protein [Dehalococcoidia bacterium]